jgi:hypothetical protein
MPYFVKSVQFFVINKKVVIWNLIHTTCEMLYSSFCVFNIFHHVSLYTTNTWKYFSQTGKLQLLRILKKHLLHFFEELKMVLEST